MILTQRQIEQLIKQHGKLVLPFRARLTPSAQDYLRHNKLTPSYDEVKIEPKATGVNPCVIAPARSRFLWWSDGPCGICKAAVGMTAREAALEPMPILEDASRAISAIRTLDQSVASNNAHGGVLLVKNSGPATVLANKASALRAVVATTMAAVEESVATVAANVLVVEREKWSLSPLKNLLTRFCKLERKIDAVTQSEMKSLGCSGCPCKSGRTSSRPLNGGCSGCPCAGGCR